jgi:hypothetical protein
MMTGLDWRNDWRTFAEAVASDSKQGLSDEQLSEKYHGQRVRWTGKVNKVDLPDSVIFSMPARDISVALLVVDIGARHASLWHGVQAGDELMFSTTIKRERAFSPGVSWRTTVRGNGFLSVATMEGSEIAGYIGESGSFEPRALEAIAPLFSDVILQRSFPSMSSSEQVGAVVVCSDCEGLSDIVSSNFNFLAGQFGQLIRFDEVSRDAFLSFCVLLYEGEVRNGGFSQFVYNTKWDEQLVKGVEDGLRAIGATRHLELFDECAEILYHMSPEKVLQFMTGEYFGENEQRDILDGHFDRFLEIQKEEDLTALNANWLLSLPNLVVMSKDQMQQEIERRAAAVPDRKRRIAEAETEE